MKIKKINIKNSNVNISERIDNIDYRPCYGLKTSDFDKLLTSIKNLDSNRRDEIFASFNEILSTTDSAEQKSTISKTRNKMIEYGIGIAQSLTSSGLFELAKILLS